jgi:hypothetical protein
MEWETRGGESLRCQDYQGQGGDYSQLLLRRMSGLSRKISDRPGSIKIDQ